MISIHNAVLLSCHFRKIATVSHFRLVWSPFPLFSSPGAWHCWTLGLVIIYSWLWYPARYYIQNCLKTLSFYLWLLKWNIYLENTTCSINAFHRGPHQKVISFVFYRQWHSEEHKDTQMLSVNGWSQGRHSVWWETILTIMLQCHKNGQN